MFDLMRVGLAACFATLLTAATPANTSALDRAKAEMARMPLRFEANQGHMDASVRYAARAGGYTLLLRDRGPALSFADCRPIEIAMPGSAAATAIEPLDRLATRTDFIIGDRRNWRTEIPSYSGVRYRAVYPGIDVVYYGNRNELEFDFVLAPGADPKSIRMQYRGASRVRLNAEGDLVIGSGKAQVVQRKPFIYQEDPVTGKRQPISGRYVLSARNTVGLRVAGYDRKRPLVIDPVINYLTYLGGRGLDRVNAVKLGPDGRLYVTGQTDTSLVAGTEGAFSTTNVGLTDAFLAVFDTRPEAQNQLVYFSYIGGTALDIAQAIDVDTAGFVYLTGTTTSTDFPLAATPLKSTGATSTNDAFVTKLRPSDPGAEAVWYSTYLGGDAGHDFGTGIAVDANGIIYVAGTTRSSDFPVTATASQSVIWGDQDAFLAKFDPNSGSMLYATYIGGESTEEGRAIALGSNGLVYVAAATLSQFFPWTGTGYATIPLGTQDIGLGIVDTDKAGSESLVYASYFGGSGIDDVRGLSLDPNGNVLISGYTLSTDFPVTTGALQSTNLGNGDAFIAVLDLRQPNQSSLIYSTYLGGAGGDVAYDAKADAAGNIYVTGYTLSRDFPVAGSAPQPEWGGGTNIFLTKFKPGVAGREALLFSSYLGQTGTYVANGIAVGADGTMYVTGYGNFGLPLTEQHVQGFEGGQSDGFIFVIRQ